MHNGFQWRDSKVKSWNQLYSLMQNDQAASSLSAVRTRLDLKDKRSWNDSELIKWKAPPTWLVKCGIAEKKPKKSIREAGTQYEEELATKWSRGIGSGKSY